MVKDDFDLQKRKNFRLKGYIYKYIYDKPKGKGRKLLKVERLNKW